MQLLKQFDLWVYQHGYLDVVGVAGGLLVAIGASLGYFLYTRQRRWHKADAIIPYLAVILISLGISYAIITYVDHLR
jgi:hypothetical protein